MILDKLAMPWKDAVIIKLLGMSLNYHVMKERLKNLWRLTAVYDVMLVGYGYLHGHVTRNCIREVASLEQGLVAAEEAWIWRKEAEGEN